MKFEFGKYTEVTAFVLGLRKDFYGPKYIRFFICTDTWDYWFIRVQKDVNEDYENETGVYLIERDKIAKGTKVEIMNMGKLKEVVMNDELESWDIKEYTSMTDIIEDIDAGNGILELDKEFAV